MSVKCVFSGHESFPCRSLWLKKGHDFVSSGKDFNKSNAVIDLGVGKNMVASIRCWLKSFGLYDGKGMTPLSYFIFDKEKGRDQYIEDLGTLWLLHYLLVSSQEATLYSIKKAEGFDQNDMSTIQTTIRKIK